MISTKDIQGFFGDASLVSNQDYVLFHYEFETEQEPRLTAAQLCAEQSTAQWDMPGVELDLRPRFGAKIVLLEVLSENSTPLLKNNRSKATRFFRCRLVVAHPWKNFGSKIPNLLSAMAGEGAFYCPGITTLRITDVTFSNNYLQLFKGPQFGINGLRESLQVTDRPFFIGVVKPNIGLDAQTYSQIAYQSWLGGLDIAKDDEMLADASYSTLVDRADSCHSARVEAEKMTGKPKMWLANITDDPLSSQKHYHEVVKRGANAVMLNYVFTGLGDVHALRSYSSVPITGHFTGLALMERIPYFGMDSVVFMKLQRLAGADIIIMPGFGERMYMSDESVLRNCKACLEPMGHLRAALPVPGGSDWAGTLPGLYQKLGHPNFGFICGRGVYNHPDGPTAGAKSLHQAWQAIQNKTSLQEHSRKAPELQKALEAWLPS